MNDRELVRLLVQVAENLEEDSWTASAGVVRIAARRLAELPPEPAPGTCQGCGVKLTQPSTGRPRRWCGRGRCEAGKTREKSTMAS